MSEPVRFSPEDAAPPVFRVSPLLRPQVDRLRNSSDEDRQVLGAILERIDLLGQESAWQSGVLAKTVTAASASQRTIAEHAGLIAGLVDDVRLLKREDRDPLLRTSSFFRAYGPWIAGASALLLSCVLEPMMLGYWEAKFQASDLTPSHVEVNVKQ